MTFHIIKEQFHMDEAESRSGFNSADGPKDMTQTLTQENQRHNVLTKACIALSFTIKIAENSFS